jgi:hypothetical protein
MIHILRYGRILPKAARNQLIAGCDKRAASWAALSYTKPAHALQNQGRITGYPEILKNINAVSPLG